MLPTDSADKASSPLRGVDFSAGGNQLRVMEFKKKFTITYQVWASGVGLGIGTKP